MRTISATHRFSVAINRDSGEIVWDKVVARPNFALN
jgi:hypothetical protein